MVINTFLILKKKLSMILKEYSKKYRSSDIFEVQLLFLHYLNCSVVFCARKELLTNLAIWFLNTLNNGDRICIQRVNP